MRKYLYNFSNSLQSLAEYRLSLTLDILGNFISNLVVYLFWFYLATSGMNIGSYTTLTLGIYFLVVSVLGAATGFDAHNVAQDIRDGDVTQFLLKPISYMWLKFSASFAHNLLKLSVGILIFLVLTLFGVSFPVSAANLLFFFIAVAFSILGNHLIYFTVGLFAFWTKQIFGLAAMVSIGSSIVSGRLIPIELLPASVVFLSNLLPFRYFVFFPAQIFMDKLSLIEILTGLSIQLFWVVALYLLSLFVWKIGQKELEAVGI